MRIYQGIVATLFIAALASGLSSSWAASPAKISNSKLDAISFYDILLSDILALRGDYAQSSALRMRAAKRLQDDALFKESIAISSRSSTSKAVNQNAANWARSRPASEEAAALAISLMDKQHPEFEEIARKHLVNKPQSPLCAALASKLFTLERKEDGLKQAQICTKNQADQASPWYTLGVMQSELKNWKAAKQSLERFIRIEKASKSKDPALSRARINQAYLALATNAMSEDNKTQMNAYLATMRKNQANEEQLMRVLSLYAQTKQLDKGETMLDDWPQASEGEKASYLLAQIQFYRESEQWQKLYDLLDKMNATDEANADSLYEQAIAAEKLKQDGVMEKLLRRAVQLDSKHFHSYNALGYSFVEKGVKLDEARELIGKAMQLAPRNPYITDSMGWLEYKSGNISAAINQLREAYLIAPDVEIAAHLGEVLWVNKQEAEAKKIWQAGFKANPKNATLLETMGRFGVKPH